MKRRNKYLSIVTYTITFLLTTCSEDFLKKVPQGVIFEEDLANEVGLQSLLIGAYAELDGFSDGINGPWESAGSNWIYGDLYADDAHTGSVYNDQPQMIYFERYEQIPAHTFLWSKWKAVYDGISRCNDVLRVTDIALDIQTIDEKTAIQFKAEARFLRGHYHLETIKMWDFVPYVDEKVTGESPLIENIPATKLEINAGDTPWEQLGGDGYIPWDKVEEDFQYAIDHLPEVRPSGEKGRTYKYPALCFMAKLKMYKGEYVAALGFLNEVISSGLYTLPENFHENFKARGNNNSESIFQCQHSVNDGSGGANGNLGDQLNYPWAWGWGDVEYGGFNFFKPSFNLVNAFKTTDGIVGGVIAGLPYLQAFGLDYNEEDVINDEDLDSSDPYMPEQRPLDPRLDWTVGRRGIPYLDWGVHPGKDWQRPPDYFYGGPYHPKKNGFYQGENGTYNEEGWAINNANNYSLVRYADVLLMAAECEVEGGNLSLARDLVNEVRGRMADNPEYWVRFDDGSLAANYQISLYPNGGPSDPFQTQEGAREAVRFERRLELALEGHRFWDLKRWGIAKSTLNAYLESEGEKCGYLKGAVFKDRNIRHPIPQDERDISLGTLHQNPGY
jgi:hypothetical protein